MAPSDDKVMTVMEEPITYSPLHSFVSWDYLKALHSLKFEKWDKDDFAIKPTSTWVFDIFIWGSIAVPVNYVMFSVAYTDEAERMSKTADTRNQFLCLSIQRKQLAGICGIRSVKVDLHVDLVERDLYKLAFLV